MAARETPFTLFPYTTLFRSASFGTEPMPRDAGLNQAFADIFTRFPNTLFVVAAGNDEQRVREPREDVRERLVEDRKSTRLNSSHVENSYAVFCLKKKNRENQRPTVPHRAPISVPIQLTVYSIQEDINAGSNNQPQYWYVSKST